MDRLALLEERIRKAAELIRTLKQERAALEKRVKDRDAEIEELREQAAEADGRGAAGAEAAKELEALRRERKEILSRVEKMLGLLDEAAALAGEEDLLAGVEEAD